MTGSVQAIGSVSGEPAARQEVNLVVQHIQRLKNQAAMCLRVVTYNTSGENHRLF